MYLVLLLSTIYLSTFVLCTCTKCMCTEVRMYLSTGTKYQCTEDLYWGLTVYGYVAHWLVFIFNSFNVLYQEKVIMLVYYCFFLLNKGFMSSL